MTVVGSGRPLRSDEQYPLCVSVTDSAREADMKRMQRAVCSARTERRASCCIFGIASLENDNNIELIYLPH